MAFQMFVDRDGLPYSDYGIYGGVEIGIQHSILAVAERGLWYWQSFSLGTDRRSPLLSYDWKKWPANKEAAPTNADQARTMMFHCAKWLCDNIVHRDGFAVWLYPYDTVYGTDAGWASAHAQATGMQLLLRAAQIGDASFAANIDALLAAFDVPVDAGGLRVEMEAGPWFEKLASAGNEQPRILNGMLFALLGLFDVARLARNSRAKKLATDGTATVLAVLPQFDLGDWSAYDIKQRRASRHYHAIHIKQLRRLARLTGDARFTAWHDKFAQQRTQAAERRAVRSTRPWSASEPAGDNFRGAVARSYLAERVNQPLWQAEHEAVRELLQMVPDGGTVLDVPFGTGRFVPLYQHKAMTIHGVDSSPDMLDEARNSLGEAARDCQLQVARAESLPYADSSVDLVVSVRFLESIVSFADALRAIREFRRVTRRYALFKFNNRLDSELPLPAPQPHERMASKLYYSQIVELLKQQGFSVIADRIALKDRDGKGEKRLLLLEKIAVPNPDSCAS